MSYTLQWYYYETEHLFQARTINTYYNYQHIKTGVGGGFTTLLFVTTLKYEVTTFKAHFSIFYFQDITYVPVDFFTRVRVCT